MRLNGSSISELLGHSDIEIVTAETGSDALRFSPHAHCDCVVLDLKLPDMTGFEILEKLKADELLSDVPVVVFTGRELTAEEDARLAHHGAEHRGERRRIA